MRGVRRELLSVAVVLAAVGAVAVAFPYDAVFFRPAARKAKEPVFAAFVSLREGEEVAAMKAAKSSWSGEAGGVRQLRAELFVAEIPEAGNEPALELADRFARVSPPPVAPGLSPYQPSLAALPPKAIPAEKEDEKKDAPAFSREELLKID